MFVTNWISTTKIQKISEITNFFRHYFLSRTEVADCIKDNKRRIAFFRTKDALGIELYRFVGVFHLDTDATRKQGKCIWHRDSKIYEL